MSVDSDQPETLEELIANRVASRIRGKCPAVAAEYVWAKPEDKKICQWPVYYDIDAFTLDLILAIDSPEPAVKLYLSGSLDLYNFYGAGESGWGEISTQSYLDGISVTEKSADTFIIEGTIPLNIKGEGETVALADRAYPGDVGLNVIRMDGLTRRNARRK